MRPRPLAGFPRLISDLPFFFFLEYGSQIIKAKKSILIRGKEGKNKGKEGKKNFTSSHILIYLT